MKSFEFEAIELTRECLDHFWQRDCKYAVNYFADDVIWVGSRQDQYIIGKKEAQTDLENDILELQPCHLLNAEFNVVASTPKVCVVTGRYLVTTGECADYFLQVQQRCTFVWKLTNDGLRISHIHISNPMGELSLRENERFPNYVGKMAHRYLINHALKSKEIASPLCITGDGGSLFFIHLSEILYISASKRNAVIFTVNGQIPVRESISDIAAKSNDKLISIHRSFLVNPDYISSVERFTVTMTDGSKLPIPEKKFNELRTKLLQKHNSKV